MWNLHVLRIAIKRNSPIINVNGRFIVESFSGREWCCLYSCRENVKSRLLTQLKCHMDKGAPSMVSTYGTYSSRATAYIIIATGNK